MSISFVRTLVVPPCYGRVCVCVWNIWTDVKLLAGDLEVFFILYWYLLRKYCRSLAKFSSDGFLFMVKSSQTIIWAQVDVLGSESHSIHCPKKTVVWDCDIGNDHHDVPAKHLDFWTWDVANPRTTTPIYLFGFYGHGGGLSREPCSTVYLHFSWRST